MKLKKIIDNLSGIIRVEGKTNLEIRGIACDSKAVKPGYLFIALKGSKVNGADFIDDAIGRGACAILLDAGDKGIFKRGDTFIYTKDARLGLAQASQAYFGDLSNKMRLVGITGTNGKTTITYLMESMLQSRGEAAGVIGTVNYRFGRRLIPAVNTTPSSLELYSLLSGMHKEKIKNCIMEISSHSLEQGRVETLQFDAAVFTNLTREHLDFHKNMDEYLGAKLKLFSKIKKGGFSVVNIDDPASEKIIQKVRSGGKAEIITYAIDREADITAKNIKLSCDGLKFRLSVSSRLSAYGGSLEQYSSSGVSEANEVEKYIDIGSNLIGRHNIYNILAAVGAGFSLGMSLEDIKKGVEALKGLPGRLESISCGQNFSVYVDYAHTEDGLLNVLKSLRELKPARLILVFGCGGNRDRSKRPAMGKISTELSDIVFITSDNPRAEDPKDIINEITKGVNPAKNNYTVEPDRFNAIRKALVEAHEGDIVLIAGKGHETYQIFKDTTIPFDDREIAKKILRDKNLNIVRVSPSFCSG
ncbi:MAG: UDP-N-acetylmuramoyl-L-alanyl-D-glutamate--2,6-diaminopimelate ligase [Candidatus Omnitrophota bacterium]|nr:UDP-N-acetylmuramoyl-L-alanyl-D-glutamate--2,6-diaminopimelate ligase [Candidatus Omnitrophota bacterium]